MMYRNVFGAVFVVALFVGGCASEDSTSDDTSSADITSGQKLLAGSWKAVDDADFESLVLLGNGTFIHDQLKSVYGMTPTPNADQTVPVGRDTGTFTVNKSKKSLRLIVKQGWHAGETHIYEYDFKAAPAVNAPPPGANQPVAKLKLTRSNPPPNFKWQPTTYEAVTSWCSVDDDCVKERATKTWTPSTPGLGSACVSGNVCRTIQVPECDAIPVCPLGSISRVSESECKSSLGVQCFQVSLCGRTLWCSTPLVF